MPDQYEEIDVDWNDGETIKKVDPNKPNLLLRITIPAFSGTGTHQTQVVRKDRSDITAANHKTKRALRIVFIFLFIATRGCTISTFLYSRLESHLDCIV